MEWGTGEGEGGNLLRECERSDSEEVSRRSLVDPVPEEVGPIVFSGELWAGLTIGVFWWVGVVWDFRFRRGGATGDTFGGLFANRPPGELASSAGCSSPV